MLALSLGLERFKCRLACRNYSVSCRWREIASVYPPVHVTNLQLRKSGSMMTWTYFTVTSVLHCLLPCRAFMLQCIAPLSTFKGEVMIRIFKLQPLSRASKHTNVAELTIWRSDEWDHGYSLHPLLSILFVYIRYLGSCHNVTNTIGSA